MNPTLDLLHAHRSDRAFADTPVSDAELDAILRAAWHAPTALNSQQVSAVVVRDPARRARLAEIAGGQPWIAQAPVFVVLVADFYKTAQGVARAGETQHQHEGFDGVAAAVLDCGIALGNLMTAARSLGLGVVPIGGIRHDMPALIELLALPPLTLPFVGVCIGHVATPAQPKPRLAFASFRHDEQYDTAAIGPAIDAYDAELAAYWTRVGRSGGLNWSQNTAQAYKLPRYPHTLATARAQQLLQPD